jgi:hypothetical protein
MLISILCDFIISQIREHRVIERESDSAIQKALSTQTSVLPADHVAHWLHRELAGKPLRYLGDRRIAKRLTLATLVEIVEESSRIILVDEAILRARIFLGRFFDGF